MQIHWPLYEKFFTLFFSMGNVIELEKWTFYFDFSYNKWVFFYENLRYKIFNNELGLCIIIFVSATVIHVDPHAERVPLRFVAWVAIY